jgi:hypothetical protein
VRAVEANQGPSRRHSPMKPFIMSTSHHFRTYPYGMVDFAAQGEPSCRLPLIVILRGGVWEECSEWRGNGDTHEIVRICTYVCTKYAPMNSVETVGFRSDNKTRSMREFANGYTSGLTVRSSYHHTRGPIVNRPCCTEVGLTQLINSSRTTVAYMSVVEVNILRIF